MILADTVGYHRGGKPTSGVRILATFTYTSATPMMTRKMQVPAMPAWASLPIPAIRHPHIVSGFSRTSLVTAEQTMPLEIRGEAGVTSGASGR